MSDMGALRAIIRDEMLQVIATGVVAILLLAINQGVQDYLADVLAATGETGDMHDVSNARLAALGTQTAAVLHNLGDVSIELGQEASRGVFCNFLGVGYTIVNCSPLNAFRGSLTSAAFTASVALADTYAQQFILSLAKSFAFQFLIPLGLLLRCFKLSRQAGGALIAIGFGFYTVYPTVIVATDNLLHDTAHRAPVTPVLGLKIVTKMHSPQSSGECLPRETDVSVSFKQFKYYSDYLNSQATQEGIVYFILVRVLFLSILNLIITLGFIRAFAHMIGSDIDLSSLARIS